MKLYFVKPDGGRRCIIALDEIEETAAVCYDGEGSHGSHLRRAA